MEMTVRAFMAAVLLLIPGQALARDRVMIVGSSTVFPFATAVAEKVGENGLKFPIVESTGSGAGFALFCAGAGDDTPDITNASRRMKKSEFDTCKANGVTPVEVEIGYDGIVLANSLSGPDFSVTVEQLYEALAEKLSVNGVIAPNPNVSWADIDAALPDEKIEVLGPPPTSGTRDAFEELVMDVGCEAHGGMPEEGLCTRIRKDGSFFESGENDDLIVGALEASPERVGIFGYSFLDQNADQIRGLGINGIKPTFDNIATGVYPVSRPLFFYIKKEHVGRIPGIEDYVAAFTAEEAWGDEGYLAGKGLIPLAREIRQEQAKNVRLLVELQF